MQKKYNAIGLMSGSSLDGIDLAYTTFTVEGENIDFELRHAESVPIEAEWIAKLKTIALQNAETFFKTHVNFGHYLGDVISNFIQKYELKPDFIASHGHTIFHDPVQHFTTQIGDGAAIAAVTRQRVISDFRSMDIAVNGEGAPIAPAADRYLLKGYDFFMNLGGISNVTCNIDGRFIAFDIGGANQILNALANTIDLEFDRDGTVASRGKVYPDILDDLSKEAYFKQPYPKSLANSWVQALIPLFLQADCSIEDKMRTAVEHIANEIAVSFGKVIQIEKFHKESYKLIITGGGAFNGFLIKTIQEKVAPLNIKVEIPSSDIVDYKEAILMGLMGVLRIEQRVNCFSSVTGAKRDTIGGAIYEGKG